MEQQSTPREKQGLDALAAMFAEAESQNRAAFMPFFPIGYPNYDESMAAITAMAEADVDGFEIGIPFSDPVADGPTIQAATQISLENGTTLKTGLQAIRELRAQGIHQPMMIFSYLNPLLAYGTGAIVRDAKSAGADGFIIPDLPPEEHHLFADACEREGMALIFFLAPTSNSARIKLVTERATGFIYVVSLTGITGARSDLPADLADFIARLRQETDSPLVLGFGISTPDHARMVNKLVNGFIVGSALVKAGKEGTEAVRELATNLRNAIES